MLETFATVAVVAALVALAVEARGMMAERDSREATMALLWLGIGCLTALGGFAVQAQIWTGVAVAVGGAAALGLGLVPSPRRAKPVATETTSQGADVVVLHRAA